MIKNIACELPHDLLDDLRLKILGNLEISGKNRNWLEIETSAQSLF